VDGSYLNRWASWVTRWLLASLAVTVGACSWWSTADRGGPMSAFRACAEPSMWDSAQLPEPRWGRQEVRCATLTVPVDYADPGRGSHTAFGRSPCVAEHVTLYLVELRVPGGHAC